MSHSGDVSRASRPPTSSSSLKRKREDYPLSPTHSSLGEASKTAKLNRSASATNSASRSTSAANGSTTHYRSPDSEGNHQSESGDILQGVGSASSLTSTASSVFSHNSQAQPHNSKASALNGLTPLTSRTETSPPHATTSTSSGNTTNMSSTNGRIATTNMPAADPALETSQTSRPQMLPPQGTAKGYRAVWDPELDGKLSKEERKRAQPKKREFGLETYEPDPPPDPRLAIPGYMSGNCRPKDKPSKAILRVAPYSLAPYKIDRYSVGPGEPQQICAVGFDPFTSETQLRTIFGQFGSVAQLQNKINPNTGSFLGIALIKYRDSVRDGQEVLATVAAKRAEQEMHGQRINLHTVRVECDREGKRCQRHVENVLERARRELQKERSMHTQAAPPPPVEQAAIPAKIDSPAPPLNAPKGPSGAPKGPSGRTSIPAGPAASFKPPEGPKAAAVPNPRSIAASLVEEEPILGKIKRKPYIHIPHSSVPVLGTTIPHLKKRLKAYDWREIRLDKSGYYVVFEDSKRGEDETERTFNECNRAALFTYNMEMECQKYGNPNYERSPSPERVIAEKKTRESYERLKREEEEDMEIEKQRRAENLDPVLGALEQLRTELRDRIMSDIKTRIAIPIFHDSLDPAQHVAKRRKLGLPDISDHENKAPSVLLTKAGDASHNPRSRFGQGSKPLRPHDPNQQRRGGRFGDRERDRDRAGGNAFMDERRRKPPPRPVHARGLHYRLQQMYDQDEDSDDERRTSPTRDTEEQESRPLSRNSTPFDSESLAGDTPKHTRRKVSEWEEEDKETFDALQKQLIGHLLHKEPEDLATRELELVIGTLPRTSRYCARAKTELFIRQKAKEDDALFSVKSEVKKDLHEDVVMGGQERDSTPALEDTKAVKEPAKKKRKSKKQIFEEREALKAEVEEAAAAAAEKPVEPSTLEKVNQKKVELEVADNNEYREVDLRVSLGKPKRTVADNASVVLDIDGWQHTIKDDEDLHFARKALEQERMAAIGDVKLWAWKQKQIKTLNNGGAMGISHGHQTGITGYYVPNPTGSARTEGVKKILNEEKSKYLPHRIKVQRAREERQAEAKANPTAAAEAAKTVAAEKLISTATSRSNRVNNRRLVNDINLQREALAASSGGASTDADTAIRFNQLKKRKKLVKFDRSAIHGWGLYAEENIAVNDLIIEYVGEKVRQKVADLREIKYEKQGVGSSYLFRMMDDEIVDATKKGGIARFINHSCSPNCTAKIIKVEGTPRIVIYALKDIGKNEELTYDYKFEREIGSTDRIPCLCGSANCKGFLN